MVRAIKTVLKWFQKITPICTEDQTCDVTEFSEIKRVDKLKVNSRNNPNSFSWYQIWKPSQT